MRIYFASDLHASERCWRKFLAANRHYGADIVIVGGDITGKFLVPIIDQGDGTWRASVAGQWRTLRERSEVERLKGQLSDAGSYPYETDQDEFAVLEVDQARVDELFLRLVRERVEQWVGLADERFRGEGVRCFVSGANDDFPEIDPILEHAETIEWPEGRPVDLGDGVVMVSVGYGNPTPWNCPRDIPEGELAARIEEQADQLSDLGLAIFNLHVPPFDSRIDYAPLLDAELRVVMTPMGQPEMVPVGSTAVRDAIDKYQPLLGLHGHIHESKGVVKRGRTTAVNPGSEYQEGLLDGAVIDLDPRRGTVAVELVTG